MGLITLPCFRRQPTWIDRPPFFKKNICVWTPRAQGQIRKSCGFIPIQWIQMIPMNPMNPPWTPYEPPMNPLSQPHHWMFFWGEVVPWPFRSERPLRRCRWGSPCRNLQSLQSPRVFLLQLPMILRISWDISTRNLTKATYTPTYLLYLLEICAIAMEHSFFVGKSSNNMG